MLNNDLQKFYKPDKLTLRWRIFKKFLLVLMWILISISQLTYSTTTAFDSYSKVRPFTSSLEFDYGSWILQAAWQKVLQSSISAQDYVDDPRSSEIVRSYLKIESDISRVNAELQIIYGDPNLSGKEQLLKERQDRMIILRNNKAKLGPIAESVLQKQVSQVLSENGLSVIGQPLPPVLYHSTPLPMALIVSPRDVIRQDANISLLADMTAGDMVAIEDQVMQQLKVSALVVPVGGVGVYPTMVMATSDLNFLVDTIAHEWTHNFLTTRPLGLNYETNPDMRTINETTASIVGNEIGTQLLLKYYPDLLPPQIKSELVDLPDVDGPPTFVPEPETFDFRKEMHTTRVRVDDLLSNGKVEEAEGYMEERRLLFWENGYALRRLNQAYFAFYGAYADVPGGAAGKDPVGPTVRLFREQSGSLSRFLERISWVTSYAQLESMVRVNSQP